MYIAKDDLIYTANKNLGRDLLMEEFIKVGDYIQLNRFSRIGANQAEIEFYVPSLNNYFLVTVYEKTNVITRRESDNAQLINTGGWYTATTKKLINKYSKFKVWQDNFQWYTGLNNCTMLFSYIEGKFI